MQYVDSSKVQYTPLNHMYQHKACPNHVLIMYKNKDVTISTSKTHLVCFVFGLILIAVGMFIFSTLNPNKEYFQRSADAAGVFLSIGSIISTACIIKICMIQYKKRKAYSYIGIDIRDDKLKCIIVFKNSTQNQKFIKQAPQKLFKADTSIKEIIKKNTIHLRSKNNEEIRSIIKNFYSNFDEFERIMIQRLTVINKIGLNNIRIMYNEKYNTNTEKIITL